MKYRNQKHLFLPGCLLLLGLIACIGAVALKAVHDHQPALASMAVLPFLPLGMVMKEADKGGGTGASKHLEGVRSHIDALKTKANEWLQGMKPLEQHEGAEQLNWVFNRLKGAHQELCDMLDHCARTMEPRIAQAMQEAQEEAKKDEGFLKSLKEQILQSGDYVTKADADGRVDTARQSALTEARETFMREQQEAQTLAARRGEALIAVTAALTAAKVKEPGAAAQEVCGKIADDTLKAGGYKEAIGAIVRRVGACAELGIGTAVLQEVASMPLDEAGTASFDRQFATWDGIARARPGTPVKAPFAVKAQQERQSGEKPRVAC